MSKTNVAPLLRTNGANRTLTFVICIFALILLVCGNNVAVKGYQFWGTDLDDLLNNIGLAALIAAITQFYTDFRVRGAFYSDISDHILANQTLRDSGILTFYGDSRTCLPTDFLRDCQSLDIGMVYSDRFLKDNIGVLESGGSKLKIRVFCPDLSKRSVLKMVSDCISRTPSDVSADFSKLNEVISSLRNSGVEVEVLHMDTMPHYSFYIINAEHYFITMSTFAARRANVPLFQVNKDSPIAKLVRDDMNHIDASYKKVREG